MQFHGVLIFRKLYTWVGFNYPPWLGPKDTELRAPWGPYIQEVIYMGWVQLSFLVRPKRHGTACAIGPKGEARTLGPRAPSVPKAKLGHRDHVCHQSQRRS